MRFCMVTTFYPPHAFGGDAVFVQQLSNELGKRGHQVEVVYCRDAYNLMGGRTPLVADQEHPNVTVHALKSPLGVLSPLATHQTGRPISKSAKLKSIFKRQFDVIHYHNISLVGGPNILYCGQGIKLYTLHEYWLLCPTHMLFKFNREACTAKQCLPCTLVHKRPPQLWRYTQVISQAVKQVDVFIAPSEFTKNKHLEMGLRIPMVVLPYFSSRWGRTQNTPVPAVHQTPYFLFVGRLEKIKGLQEIIPIFRRYDKAQLWIIGTGGYESVLRRLAQGSPNIQFLGQQSGERLQNFYREAVALIVPSLWYEVFGIVILEAFALATPVIVRNRGGMPKIIEESGGGFVYGTEKELLGFMERLLLDPNLRQETGQRGYEALQKNWRADVHIKQYLELIDEIAAARKKQGVAPKDPSASSLTNHGAYFSE
jgi:glycosyltransferase involved in cell wall biosynthesis